MLGKPTSPFATIFTGLNFTSNLKKFKITFSLGRPRKKKDQILHA
ncbi:hypothetical protein CAMRE0001_1132 [Campylobacter rectus RM3267]|uniref:Uncharacterized protein n=1 Tax=Campylobacter rectus RM3267 TaxID=553218 RepID=B9D0D1_CAMRE|nr:hypothetical protein CAMRE0001_1132 [Campylobacter rectus RM3267]